MKTLTDFLSVFYLADEPVWLFGYSPKEIPERLKAYPVKIRTTISELRTAAALQTRLKTLNSTHGLYFTVNSGGTKISEINRFNACFCEIDDIPIQDQHDLFDNAPLPPNLRIETKKSVHAYWILLEDLTRDDWDEQQVGLIDYFKSDPAIKNCNRVMRLPFFNHVSWSANEFTYKKVGIYSYNGGGYRLPELQEAYPVEPIPEPKEWAREYSNTTSDWGDTFDEMAERFRALPGYHVERGGRLASARGVCHSGDTNRTLVMSLDTRKIFCRAGCEWNQIRDSLGVQIPQPKFIIPRVNLAFQDSKLYRRIKGAT